MQGRAWRSRRRHIEWRRSNVTWELTQWRAPVVRASFEERRRTAVPACMETSSFLYLTAPNHVFYLSLACRVALMSITAYITSVKSPDLLYTWTNERTNFINSPMYNNNRLQRPKPIKTDCLKEKKYKLMQNSQIKTEANLPKTCSAIRDKGSFADSPSLYWTGDAAKLSTAILLSVICSECPRKSVWYITLRCLVLPWLQGGATRSKVGGCTSRERAQFYFGIRANE